jgi:hypothetical protein
MRLRGALTRHFAGYAGGVRESAEPAVAHADPFGAMAEGANILTATGGRVTLRGGSQVLQTFAADDISSVLGVWPWSPTGALAIAYDGTAEKHYAYALTDQLAFALPVATPTEAGSRVDLGWDTATPRVPVADELFEKMYVSDASLGTRESMKALAVVADALTVATPTYDLDGLGAAELVPYVLRVYNGHLFAAGFDTDSAADAPHILRNSLLGTDPSSATGFHPDSYAIIGAHGQRITAMAPGRDVLLVAKANELYRIYGSGQGLPGWHFQIQAIENARGHGVVSPYALLHVNQLWYGIGRAGPFRTDGSTVEPLGTPWRQSWRRVDYLERAVISYHPDPDRRKVWFAFYRIGDSARPQYPYEIWCWDIDRETWSPPMAFPRTFHFINALLPETSEAPADLPLSLAQRFTNGDFTYGTVTGRFTPGDYEAETEVWAKPYGGAYSLVVTLPAAIGRFVIPVTGVNPTGVKLRHKKDGVAGDYTDAILMYPMLPAPITRYVATPTAPGSYSESALTSSTYVPYSGDVTIEANNAAWTETVPDAPVGYIELGPIDNTACEVDGTDAYIKLNATLTRTDWPVSYQSSRTEATVSGGRACPPTNLSPSHPIPWQVVEEGKWASTSITIRFHKHASVGVNVPIQYAFKLASSGTWTPINITSYPTTRSVMEITIGSLTAGKEYHVRLQTNSTQYGEQISCFTAIPVPTISAVSNNLGTPSVDVTLTNPVAGATLVAWDAAEAYSATYPNHATTPTAHTTTVGTCGRPNRFFARTYLAGWPEGFQYSDVVYDDVANPCVA